MTLPDELVVKLAKSRKANAGGFNLRQIILGTFDQNIHTRGQADTKSLFAQTYLDIIGIEPIPNTNMPANFGHLAGGYDAQYYGYLVSNCCVTWKYFSFFIYYYPILVMEIEVFKSSRTLNSSQPFIEFFNISVICPTLCFSLKVSKNIFSSLPFECISYFIYEHENRKYKKKCIEVGRTGVVLHMNVCKYWEYLMV